MKIKKPKKKSNYELWKECRKPMPPPGRPFKEKKDDWKKELNQVDE